MLQERIVYLQKICLFMNLFYHLLFIHIPFDTFKTTAFPGLRTFLLVMKYYCFTSEVLN